MTMLQVGNLVLRPPEQGDLAALFALTERPETRTFLSAAPPSLADSFARLTRNAGNWALFGYGTFMVIDRPSGMMIANCGVFPTHRGLGADFDGSPEAGWIVHPDWWGRGVASAAMATALAWFDAAHGPRRSVCMIDPGNSVSDRVAQRLGYRPFRLGALPGEAHGMQLYERMPGAA